MRLARRRGVPFPPTVAKPTARLALHHLLDEVHTGKGDSRGEIEPNLVSDVWPVVARMTSSRTCVETM